MALALRVLPPENGEAGDTSHWQSRRHPVNFSAAQEKGGRVNAWRRWFSPEGAVFSAILAAALALRLAGAWCAALVFDERAHWALAETIDFHPRRLHLVSRTLDHPLLSVYVLKLDGLLFGASDFGLRLAYVLAGAATLAPLYFLARRAFSPAAGLWAAAFLAVDQFHAGWSRVFMPEVLMLLFGALALLQFVRASSRARRADMPCSGPCWDWPVWPRSPRRSCCRRCGSISWLRPTGGA